MLEVKDLTISFDGAEQPAVKRLSFQIDRGKTLSIVGESGSGKSLTSLAVMGLLPSSAQVDGKIFFEGDDVLQKEEKEIRSLRGKDIAMIFQEPMTALNPAVKCGKQCIEPLMLHLNLSKKQAKKEVLSLFDKVKIPDPKRAYDSYPHELSGGQRQRVMIAMAISCEPKLLIADEPTTALDVTVQKEILLLIQELQKETGMAVLFISHDLGVVRHISDEILVLFRGETMEKGRAEKVLLHPESKYTQGLLACRPPLDSIPKRLPTVQDYLNDAAVQVDHVSAQEKQERIDVLSSNPPILEVKKVDKWFGKKKLFGSSHLTHALNEVTFQVFEGETLGLVGESGCGKSTLGKSIVGLTKPEKGEILYHGRDILSLSSKERHQLKRDIQIIFQDPFSSLNPKQKVGDAIIEPMIVHQIGEAKKRKSQVEEILQKVGLHAADAQKYPHQFSGGQRQRIGIARALVLQPKVIVCDESVSALDVSVQAQVLNLLNDLKEEFGFTYIFISHDLSVVKYMSDHLVVMNKGQIEEQGLSEDIFRHPSQAYTQKLLNAVIE